MPKMQLVRVMIRSSVKKKEKTSPFGQPAAFIRPKSRVLCFIIKSTTKEVITAPTAKIRIPMNSMNCENTVDKPLVSEVTDWATSIPIRLLKRSRKSVEATLNVKVAAVNPVCHFLRSKSFAGKAVLLITTHQCAFFQT
jgi:hypothetical protein